ALVDRPVELVGEGLHGGGVDAALADLLALGLDAGRHRADRRRDRAGGDPVGDGVAVLLGLGVGGLAADLGDVVVAAVVAAGEVALHEHAEAGEDLGEI